MNVEIKFTIDLYVVYDCPLRLGGGTAGFLLGNPVRSDARPPRPTRTGASQGYPQSLESGC